MRPRDESAHGVVTDAINQGYIGTDRPYPIRGIQGHEAANQARLSINRAGRHLGVSIACWVVDNDGEGCWKDCQDPQAPHGVFFRLHSKNQARGHVVASTGGDPAKLKYNPFKRGTGPLVDESGQRF
jgi:hypothetical protein